MYLERLLQINVATLAALGALLLGMGQRSIAAPLLVMLAAGVSIWLTDVTGRFLLGRKAANVLMLTGGTVALVSVFPLHDELQALSLAWLLTYLQILLFFQPKDEHKYRLLGILSLLQVIVSALFGQGIFFGVLLAVYMLLGFLAMTLLMMHRQWERCAERKTELIPFPGNERNEFRFTNERNEFRFTSNSELRSRQANGMNSVLRGVQPRWPLAADRSQFAGVPAGGSHLGIGKPLFRTLGRMGLRTLGLTVVLFFAVPRFGLEAWRGPISQPVAQVGFTDKVNLGEFGGMMESYEPVMRVRFYSQWKNAPLSIRSPLYLQGAVLMLYDQGQWQTGHPAGDYRGTQVFQRPDELRRHPGRFQAKLPGLVRQETTTMGAEQNDLFFVAPYIPLEDNSLVDIDRARQRLCRSIYSRGRRLKYVLGTTAIVDGRQSPLAPVGPNDTAEALAMPDGEHGSTALPRLVALAGRWIKESKLPEDDRLGQARLLEQKLATSDQFHYSLNRPDYDPSLDPIEDFVSKHPRGNCEYFATALALMLRSQKIPARMISGYRCDPGDWEGDTCEVRQYQAHTWVEVYLHPSQLRRYLRSRQLQREWLHGEDYWPWYQTGAWLRLDPTPAGADEERRTWFTPIRQKFDRLESAWLNYVVELDVERQRDAIYGPIAGALAKAWKEATDAANWRAIANSSLVATYFNRLNREVRWILVGLVVVFVAAAAAGLVWSVWRIGRRLAARWRGDRPARFGRRGTEVECYRRLERFLARRGMVRAASQTQREFAVAAGARLAAATGQSRLAALPLVVADAFYRVRFGRMPLDNSQTEAVEHALRELFDEGKAAAKGRRP
jgi:protein-glutamine gamma-glutamyltransferase